MVCCFGCFGGDRSNARHAKDGPARGADKTNSSTKTEACAHDSQPTPPQLAPAPTTTGTAPFSSIQDPSPVQQAPLAPQPASSSSKESKESSEDDGTTTITSSSSSSDCISLDHGSSSGGNASAQAGQYITQVDSLSQLLGVQEQVKDAGDTQVPGQLLLVVLELFLKLDAKSAEAAVHSLEAPGDSGTDCIYDAFRSSMSELCSMPTPPSSSSEAPPLPRATAAAAPFPQPPPPSALQQDNQSQQHTQSCSQLQSSGTTTRIMRNPSGRVGLLAGALRSQAQAQHTNPAAAAIGATHTASATSGAAETGSCNGDAQSKSSGCGSKGKEDSYLPGLFERQSQGAQQHNIEIWERFSQVRTSQKQAMQQYNSQQFGRVSSLFPQGMSPKASGLHRKSLPILGRDSLHPRPQDQMLARTSMRFSPEQGPYLSAETAALSGASSSSTAPAAQTQHRSSAHHSSAATTTHLSSSNSPLVAPHSPGVELSRHSPPASQIGSVKPRTNLLLEPRHLPYGREGPPWPGDCAWCQKHAAQQQQQQRRRRRRQSKQHGSMSSAPLFTARSHSDPAQRRPSQQGGLQSCLQPDPRPPSTGLENHAQEVGHVIHISPAQLQQPLPDTHDNHYHRHAHSTSNGAGTSDPATLPHHQLRVQPPNGQAAPVRRPSLKHVQFSSATTSHWFKSSSRLDTLSSQQSPTSPPPRTSSITEPQLPIQQQQQAPQGAPLQPSSPQHSCAAHAHRHHSIARSSPQLAMDSACVEASAQEAREPVGLSAPCLWRWWWWWGLADFELTEHLHSGKSSEVVQGTCKRSGTTCVIKAYSLLHMSESERVHLHREITLQRRLDHPSITQLYCAFVEQGMFAPGSDARFTHLSLVLEHAPGGNLARYLKERGGQLPEAEAVELVMRPLLTALQYIHEQGIVHRDIKPENLLLDADKRLKIADFGLAVDADAGQNTFAGTLSYMSPELYSVMPKALNRSATTVSRLKHTITATDLESSKSSEECAKEAPGGVSKLSPVPSPYVSSAHASSPALTQELAGRISAGPCGDNAGLEAVEGSSPEPAPAKPCAQEKTSSNPRSVCRRRHSEGSESVRTSHTSHASKASRASRASRRSVDTVRSVLQHRSHTLIPEVQEQGSDATAPPAATLPPNRRASMPMPSGFATQNAGMAVEGSSPANSRTGVACVASPSPPFNAAAAAAAAAARRPVAQQGANAGASRFAFGSPPKSNQPSGAASKQHHLHQQHHHHQHRSLAGRAHGTWMVPSPSSSPAPSSLSSVPSNPEEQQQRQQKQQKPASVEPSERNTCPSSPAAPELPTDQQQQASRGTNGGTDLPLHASHSSPAAAGPASCSSAAGVSGAVLAPVSTAAGAAWRRPVPRQASAGASRFAGGAAATPTSTSKPCPAPPTASGVSRRPGVKKQASSSAASKVWASPFGTAIMQRSSRGVGTDAAALAGWEGRAAAAGSEGSLPLENAAAAASGSPRPWPPPLQQSTCLLPEGGTSADGLPVSSSTSPPSAGTAGALQVTSPYGHEAEQEGTDLRVLVQGQKKATAAAAGEQGSLAAPHDDARSAVGSPAGGAAAATVNFAESPQHKPQQQRLPAAIPHSRSAGQVLGSEMYHQANGGSGAGPFQGGEQERSSPSGGRPGRYSWEAVEGEEAAHGLGVGSRPRSAAQLGRLAGIGAGSSTFQRMGTQSSQRSKSSSAQQGVRVEGPGGVGAGRQGSLGMNSMLSLSDEESKQSANTESRANTGGLPCSTSIDVWAVGVLTYVLLVGRHPFKRGSMQEIRNAVLAFKGRSSLDLPAHLSAEAASFITTCLHTSPLNRPPVVELLNHAWIKREKVAGSSTENG